MRFRTPKFWERVGVAAVLLYPFSLIYILAVALRNGFVRPVDIGLPVICVGNFTVGGAGKTPMVIEIARILQGNGAKPFILTRGYGGRVKSPTLVDTGKHTARDVGDEAMLLAKRFPTIVSPDRVAGAFLAKNYGATVIVMDDGLQNPSLKKTLSIAVVDGKYGIGNGFIVPAGALRAPLAQELKKVGAVIIIGKDEHKISSANYKAFYTNFVPIEIPQALKDKPLLAFAGIGRPQKFFDTLEAAGLSLTQTKSFPDHFPYDESHMEVLLKEAKELGAMLVTTEKDFVRIPKEFQNNVVQFGIQIEFENKQDFERLIIEAL